ncbi:hypothetical protein [Priestia flexa]|uniref:hypothetical protein n=1 Tax=Priestia flexa TaxID=86664 RepID=UPI0004741BE6|nr:hypothetical protein [Priestia flexa]
MEFSSTRDHINHIIHCIQENEGIQLSEKSIYDIRKTLLASNKHATSGSISNMKSERCKRYIAENKVKALENSLCDFIKGGESNEY